MSSEPRVAVLMGGKSDEHEVSLSSGQKVMSALAARDPVPVIIGRDGHWSVGGEPQASPGRAMDVLLGRADVAFLALHGPFGEDGTIQGFLEVYGMAYTGSGIMASALSMDKPRTKAIYRDARLSTPEGRAIDRAAWRSGRGRWLEELASLGWPLVVKPACLGSSVGISFPKDRPALEAALDALLAKVEVVLVEQYLKGTELTCGVLSIDRQQRTFSLPVTEIVPGEASAFFDYTAKYTPGASQEITPARVSAEVTQEVQRMALAAHQALGCRDFSRSDFILGASGKPIILETNTIPGLTATSLLPQGAAAIGIDYPALIGIMIDNAALRRRR